MAKHERRNRAHNQGRTSRVRIQKPEKIILPFQLCDECLWEEISIPGRAFHCPVCVRSKSGRSEAPELISSNRTFLIHPDWRIYHHPRAHGRYLGPGRRVKDLRLADRITQIFEDRLAEKARKRGETAGMVQMLGQKTKEDEHGS